MSKLLLIVFVKNFTSGKVKTRLAKNIGDSSALTVYKELVKITELATSELSITRHIYFSDKINSQLWPNDEKFIQQGDNIGERMSNAFSDSFIKGYNQVILIGSDLPDMNKNLITSGFKSLNTNQYVFGPALDGGYYLIGMNQMDQMIFQDKPWSHPSLLKTTCNQLDDNNLSFQLLEKLNDIDNFEDLQNSTIAEKFKFS